MAAINSNKICKYGEKCYRKNAQHFIDYVHPKAKQAPSKRQAASTEDNVSDPEPLTKKARLNPLLQQDDTNKQQAETSKSEGRSPSYQTDDDDDDDSILVKACEDVLNSSDVTQKKVSSVEHPEEAEPSLASTIENSDHIEDSSLTPAEHNVDVDDVNLCSIASLSCTTSTTPNCDVTPPAEAVREKEKPLEADDIATVTCHTSHKHEDVIACTDESPKDSIHTKFLVEMPEDFYEFWEFAKSVNCVNPSAAFASTLNLHLVGAYDMLAGKCKTDVGAKKGGGATANYLLHYRYYYDPPEFMTVLRGDDKSLFHMGYYRDDPKEMPMFVASNSASVDCLIKPRGENIFSAVSSYIDEELKRGDTANKSALTLLNKTLKSWAQSKDIPIGVKSQRMKERDKRVVSKCFHGAGLVVPVDKNDVGYRPLPETPADLKKIFKKIVESKTEQERNASFDVLMEIITLVQFANDECDYGEGLELGLDLFSYGGEVLHKTILSLLPLAYQLVGRPQYATIIEAHLADRRRGGYVKQLR